MSRKAIKVKWTERMNSDLYSRVQEKNKEMVSSNNSSYYKNGRKKGYIELIKDLWEEKGYGYLELKSENLRDQASRLGKKAVGSCEEQRKLQFSGGKQGRI